MTLDEYKRKYAGLAPASVRAMAKTDTAFRRDTEDLYKAVFRKGLNRSCSNCWEDAYIILSTTKTDRLMELKQRKFELRNGALLRDINDAGKLCSAHNLTDELAVHHLANNPENIRYFAKYPENWKELVKKYRKNASKAVSKENGDAAEEEAATEEKAGEKAVSAEEKPEGTAAEEKAGEKPEP